MIEHNHDTIPAVARLVGVPKSTIQAAVSRGEIPTQRLAGGTTVVTLEEVRRWKADTERRPGPKVRAGSPASSAVTSPATTSAGGYDPQTGSY